MTETYPHARLPWGTNAEGELDRIGVVVGSIAGVVAVFTFIPLGILGIVLNCMGLDRITTDLPAAHRYMRASWIAFAAAPLAAAALTALLSL